MLFMSEGGTAENKMCCAQEYPFKLGHSGIMLVLNKRPLCLSQKKTELSHCININEEKDHILHKVYTCIHVDTIKNSLSDNKQLNSSEFHLGPGTGQIDRLWGQLCLPSLTI